MTRREELQEAYEDAMFALLMDYVAESEGEKALEENRVLQEDRSIKGRCHFCLFGSGRTA